MAEVKRAISGRSRVRQTIAALLMVGTTVAWAAEPDQRNVYEAFSKLLTPTVGATVDERITGIIKRPMANLLYPVDLSSFVRPEKDGNFSNLIMVLQKQMGVTPTGILTSDQFDRLDKAARDIEARPIGLPPFNPKLSAVKDRYVSAYGTLAGDIAHKINFTRIECLRAEGICNMFSASIDPDTLFLYSDIPIAYAIKVWTADAIIAVSEGPCGIVETININVPANMVAVNRTGSCLEDKTPATFNLVDGFSVAWKMYEEKINKACALVYEPAQRLFAGKCKSSPVQR
jgi:hypothetical protein